VGRHVVLDKLKVHKFAGVRGAIETAGARIVYFPPYPLDFNTIEQAFAKLKALLPPAAARTAPTSAKPSETLSPPLAQPNAETTSQPKDTTLATQSGRRQLLQTAPSFKASSGCPLSICSSNDTLSTCYDHEVGSR
jgi:hypothetical protein